MHMMQKHCRWAGVKAGIDLNKKIRTEICKQTRNCSKITVADECVAHPWQYSKAQKLCAQTPYIAAARRCWSWVQGAAVRKLKQFQKDAGQVDEQGTSVSAGCGDAQAPALLPHRCAWEVLVMVMRKHQRYFPIVAAPGGPDAPLLPAFITVANGSVDQDVVAAGCSCCKYTYAQGVYHGGPGCPDAPLFPASSSSQTALQTAGCVPVHEACMMCMGEDHVHMQARHGHYKCMCVGKCIPGQCMLAAGAECWPPANACGYFLCTHISSNCCDDK
eukprot:1161244-Pelagomonas_calceolata.AAC.14